MGMKEYAVTVFECYEYTTEMIEWLRSCDSMLVNIKAPVYQEQYEMDVYGKKINISGRQKPLVVTIADDQVALMFRLKYPNVRETSTMIYSTPHIFKL